MRWSEFLCVGSGSNSTKLFFNERKGARDFERLRNLANGRNEHEGLHKIDRVIKKLEEEEKEKGKPTRTRNLNKTAKLLKAKKTIYIYIVRENA